MKNTISILLIIGIVILVNLLARDYFFRLDLTDNQQYMLSGATKNILRELDSPVTVRAYFSDNLPATLEKTQRDFKDLLVEYVNRSQGMLDYEFINPEDEEQQQLAAQEGIQPVMINVQEKDQMKQQQAFMGATIEMGEQKEIIPFIQPGGAMEYALSTGIKKISLTGKPSVGLIQGHGEPGLNELSGVYQTLDILYEVETIDLANEPEIADRFRAVAIIAPKDSIPTNELAKLDEYLSRGGNLVVAVNRVDGDLSTAQGSVLNTGLEGWLLDKGIQVEPVFLIDASCGSVSVQQPNFPFPFQVDFPYWPVITNFEEHPAAAGLEQVILNFASPVSWVGDTTVSFRPLAYTSSQSGVVTAPTFFDVSRELGPADYSQPGNVVAGVAEGLFGGSVPARIVVFGDGDFPSVNQNPDNISLLVNSIDWLSDDTGLIELRTKAVSSRPIAQEFLGDEADGRRTTYKYLNFGLPILLVILYGLFRFQRAQQLRLKRMQEKYG